MVYQLYNLLLLLSSAVLIPLYLLRGMRYGKSRRGIRERLGHFDPQLLEIVNGRKVIWVHAVSVGETRAALPLLKALRQEYPEHLLLLSNVTETGRAIALSSAEADQCIFFPFDFSWAVRRSLKALHPDLVVIVETELWPNFCRQAKQLKIPLVLVNGRISDRSFPRYQRLRFLLRPLLECFSSFCMQTQVDAERIGSLGAVSSRVHNTGNLKFDQEMIELTPEQRAERRQRYALADEAAVLVAGSTHEGEETVLLDAWQTLASGCERTLSLVLIPRHPERKQDLVKLVREKGCQGRLRSTLMESGPPLARNEVLIVDTLGEVLDLYSVADLVFVGGSLVPIGGHNLLEASMLAKPVLFGPHVNNFKVIAAKLVRAGAGVKVNDADAFVAQAKKILIDPARGRAMGEAGFSLILENTGATERTMSQIKRVMGFR